MGFMFKSKWMFTMVRTLSKYKRRGFTEEAFESGEYIFLFFHFSSVLFINQLGNAIF